MSISAFIQNPINEQEKLFYIPVASEHVFECRWRPIIERLGLKWLPLFSSGIDIKEINLNNILDELLKFKLSYIENFEDDEIIDRVNRLRNSLQKAFKRSDVKVFIGQIKISLHK